MGVQKGDLIRVTNPWASGGYYDKGDILEVARIQSNGIQSKEGAFLYPSEFEVFRKAGEEDSIESSSPTCDTCGAKLGEIACSTHLGGSFCSIKCGDYYVALNDEQPTQDAVNHPNHYTQGRIEVIDVIEDAVAGADPFEAVCHANVLKYMLRYRHKNGVEDVKKAVWYANKLIEVLSTQNERK